MQFINVFVLLVALACISMIDSFEESVEENESKFDEVRQTSLMLPTIKQLSAPNCIMKSEIAKMLNRDRRASISRPYFHHWRSTRDSSRLIPKNKLAFSPRLGKRDTTNDIDDNGEYENYDFHKRYIHQSAGLDKFLTNFVEHLKEKDIDIVYENSTEICLSSSINGALIREILDKLATNRHNQDEQEKEETRGRQSSGKHPVLFRYRLG